MVSIVFILLILYLGAPMQVSNISEIHNIVSSFSFPFHLYEAIVLDLLACIWYY